MPAFYIATVEEFLAASESEVVGKLSVAYAEEGFQAQFTDATLAWVADLPRLRNALERCAEHDLAVLAWSVLLEFVIPRKERRIDVVILAGPNIILLEQKTHQPIRQDFDQVEEYAILLHYFHKPSYRRKIIPLVISNHCAQAESRTPQTELAFTDTAAFWVDKARGISWHGFPTFLETMQTDAKQPPIQLSDWNLGEYYPVPSIIEAARSLQAGLSIPSIAHSRAAEHDVTELTDFVRRYVDEAKQNSQYLICFVTGVPGSGKTLVGLNLAFSSRGDGDALHFMSGNGPLVRVLQALFKDYQQNVRGLRATDAALQAKTLVEDVHVFARTYTKETPIAIPSNHVVIFDEAQRAWDFEQSKRKFGRETSEPTMFLRIMERHPDWAVIVALVGGGQEINDGEAGLAEWGRALANSKKHWRILASPDVVRGGDSVAGGRLLEDPASAHLHLEENSQLHLKISVRSLEAENYSKWVNLVVDGNAEQARGLRCGGFPVYVSRDLKDVRSHLRRQALGMSRFGLVGSSKAARLRAHGLEPDGTFHGGYDWDRWYLAPHTDVRASNQLEVFATEFEIQGLELDWIGLCWGGDFIWSKAEQRWLTRKFRNASVSGWSSIRKPSQQEYRRNSYRVLLTRARQGLIVYVPRGVEGDSTQSPREFDETADFLVSCGVAPLESEHESLREKNDFLLFS